MNVQMFVSTSDVSQQQQWPDVQVLLLPVVWKTPILASFGFTDQVS